MGRVVLNDEKRHSPSSGPAFLVGIDSLHGVAETIQNAVQKSLGGGASRRFLVLGVLPIARVVSVAGLSLDSTIGRSRQRSRGVVAERRGTPDFPPPSSEIRSARPYDFSNGGTEPGVIVSSALGRGDRQGSDEETS